MIQTLPWYAWAMQCRLCSIASLVSVYYASRSSGLQATLTTFDLFVQKPYRWQNRGEKLRPVTKADFLCYEGWDGTACSPDKPSRQPQTRCRVGHTQEPCLSSGSSSPSQRKVLPGLSARLTSYAAYVNASHPVTAMNGVICAV